MRIGIELRQIVPGECGGIVPLLVGVLRALFRDHPAHEYHLFCTEANAGLFPEGRPHVRREVLPLENYFPVLDQRVNARRLDVLFRSYPLDVPLAYPAERQIVLIPDLQHESFPEFFAPEVLQARRANFRAALSHAGAIGTISEHARGTIRQHPDNRCRDVFLMPPALVGGPQRPSLDRLTDEERSLIPSGEFFLFPGNLWPHKNHRRTLEAFRLFRERSGRSVELVLTGHPAGWDELARAVVGLPVRHLGFVRRELLQVLMKRARALLFFSLFEGFGIPLLEAFDLGTPVLCSNTTSLPEVGGDAVLSCDPIDPHAMSDLMLRVGAEEGLRERLAAAGRKRLARYSWGASARELLEACRRVAVRARPWAPLPWPVVVRRRAARYLEAHAPSLALAARATLHPRLVLWPTLRVHAVRLRTAAAVRLSEWRTRLVQQAEHWRQKLRQELTSRLGIHFQYPPQPLRLKQNRVRLPRKLPVISIVTPSFNQVDFLERTLRSVVDQGYPRLEYVVQDGGSTDGSRELLERYDGRLSHWESRPDGGQTQAINLGFRRTSGEIMAYLNSDDVMLPGALAYVARYFHDHPDVDVIYSHRVIIDEEDREVGRWVLPPHENEVLSWNDYVPQETLFWRRRVWERVGGALDEDFHFAMDWDLLIRLRDAGARFARVPRFLGAFRVHARQKTSARIADLGYPEIARLRQRCLGRPVDENEVQERVRPFLRRHVVLRVLHRLGVTA